MSKNQYSEPPITTPDLARLYLDEGMTQREIAEHLGVRQPCISRLMRRAGIPTRPARARSQAGPANGNWRGGRNLEARRAGHPNIEDRGYWYVWAPDHPNATKRGYVAEHIKVATAAADRVLAPGESVHHINLRKGDNHEANLVIAPDRRTHRLWHAQLEALAVGMMDEGLIGFDLERGYFRRGG